MGSEPTQRFSDRVDDYVRYRPSYPDALVSTLLRQCGLRTNAQVADIGSGSGIFTRLLLARGLRVAGVEPNPEMRAAAEKYLAGQSNFSSIDGTAEHSGLADHSVELITCAQAFHWFNNPATRGEFQRILKAGGQLALTWNRRRIEQPFQQAYDSLLREYAPEYGKLNHMNLQDQDIVAYFATGQMQSFSYDYRQQLSFSELLGRLRSSSYCPQQSSAVYDQLVDALKRLFAEHRDGDRLDFEYDSRLYLGPIAA